VIVSETVRDAGRQKKCTNKLLFREERDERERPQPAEQSQHGREQRGRSQFSSVGSAKLRQTRTE
jgi:hypothetical protein